MKIILGILIALVVFSTNAFTYETGVQQNPLQVQYFYMISSSVYVQFNPGSMPGCFSGRGGVLDRDQPQFKELYSEVMAMRYMGGKMGTVYYSFNPDRNPNRAEWPDCVIAGFDFQGP